MIGGFAIDPDLAGRQQCLKVFAKFGARHSDDLANRVTIDGDRTFAACGLADRSEHAQSCHTSDVTYAPHRLRVAAGRFGSRGKKFDTMTEILMVRHGQSEWNAQGRWQGKADPPLSPLGLQQAEAGGRYLAQLAAQLPFDGIASSTLDRAATTGDVIARHLGFDAPFRTENLAERDAGEWSGMTRPEIEEQYPGFLKARKFPPGYEHDGDLLPRIRRGLSEVIESVSGDRLIVTAHGGLIYCIESSVGMPFRHMPNLGALSFHLDDQGTFTLGERLELLVEFEGEATTPDQI